MKPALLVILSIAFYFPSQAQTTLSLISRGDLASVSGYENERFTFINKADVKVGFRTSFGVQVTVQTTRNQAMVAGVEYVTSGYDFYKELLVLSDFGTLTSSSYYKGGFRYVFVSLPLGYRFYKHVGAWRLYGQLSLIPMGYLRSVTHERWKITGEMDRGKETVRERDPFVEDLHLAGSMALGIERTVLKSWIIGVQPTFRMNFTSIPVSAFSVRPWTAGLQLNIGRQFSKN